MRLVAYVLAADPAWIEISVGAYYGAVDEILVSYDKDSKGWTGTPIRVTECLQRLRAIDVDQKMRFVPGEFFRPDRSPMQNDTHQRQCALDTIGVRADWVLQLDTDEVLPRAALLRPLLQEVGDAGALAVEWPMRVLFRKLGSGRFLEVCANGGADRFEYPGPLAIRPGTKLVDARRVAPPFVRLTVAGDRESLQLQSPPLAGETRWERLSAGDAIIHNSWARDPGSIRSKIASWGHNEGLKSRLFYYLKWKPAPYVWRWMRDFHPFARGLWPALKPCTSIPPSVLDATGGDA